MGKLDERALTETYVDQGRAVAPPRCNEDLHWEQPMRRRVKAKQPSSRMCLVCGTENIFALRAEFFELAGDELLLDIMVSGRMPAKGSVREDG